MQVLPKIKKSLLVGLFAMSAASMVAAKPPAYYVEGNELLAADNLQPLAPRTPSVALVGGGWDVAEAFRWMIIQAGMKDTATTKGRFLVIRATGTNAYNPYIYSEPGTPDPTSPHENVGGKKLGVASAATMVVANRDAAEDSFTIDKIRKAHAIFIAGGNQADYQTHWAGSPMMAEVQAAIARGVPVGGTSAGAAILGEYAFVALGGTVNSPDVLLDPFDRDATINPLNTASKKNPRPTPIVSISSLENMIVDQHVNTRDRLGRLLSFMARTEKGVCAGGIENTSTVFGIGLAEETALLVSGAPGNVTAQIATNPYNPQQTNAPGYTPRHSAYFMKYKGSPRICAAGKPLEVLTPTVVEMYRMSAPASKPDTPPAHSFMTKAKFNLSDWGAQNPTTADDGSYLMGPFNLNATGGTVIKPPDLNGLY